MAKVKRYVREKFQTNSKGCSKTVLEQIKFVLEQFQKQILNFLEQIKFVREQFENNKDFMEQL